MPDRGLLRVAGGDRTRWLNGMVSAEIASLDAEGARSGCYAALLTAKGSIVADLHILARRDAYWLETASAFLPSVQQRLARYIVADDVTLEDLSSDWRELALEGPVAASVLAAAASGAELDLAPESGCVLRVAKCDVVVAAFGVSGEPAYRLLVPVGAIETVVAALERAGRGRDWVEGTPEALEILRIEAGVPRLGAELREGVLPQEARLERAICYEKGCYVGQEIMTRLHARGRVNRLLVGLHFEGRTPPAPGTRLRCGEREVGEVTSACRSPQFGVIGLGYARRREAEPGTRLECDSVPARVAALPFGSEPSGGRRAEAGPGRADSHGTEK